MPLASARAVSISSGVVAGAEPLSAETLRRIVAEAYADHYLLMNLGFLQSDIRFVLASVLNDGGQLHAVVQLSYPGKPPFTMLASGPITYAQSEQVEEAWKRFLEIEKPRLGDAELDALIAPTFALQNRVLLLAKLALAGLLDSFGEATKRQEGATLS